LGDVVGQVAESVGGCTDQLPDPWTWRWRLTLLAAWGLWCVRDVVFGLRIAYLAEDDSRWSADIDRGPSDAAIDTYRLLYGRLRLMLNVLGLAITSIVIADCALLQATQTCFDQGAGCGELRTSATNIALLVGLLHAGGLLVIYLPPLTRVDRIARRLVSGWAPLDGRRSESAAERTGDDIAAKLDLRSKLYADLRPSGGARETIEAGAIITGPLLASLIAAFVPT
jgi:hypothetical protein